MSERAMMSEPIHEPIRTVFNAGPSVALAEARRILATVELRTEDADYHATPTILWPADLPVPTAQLRKRPFHVARILANRAADRNVFVLQPEDARILVESLAAFVGADDPGAYLAEVAR